MIILRYIYTVYAFIIFTILMSIPVVYAHISRFLISRKKSIIFLSKYFHFWSKWYCKLTFNKLDTYGYEQLDPKQQYIFVFNHSCYGDVIAVAGALKHPFSALGKIQVKDYPVMGILFKRTCILVDRADPNSRSKSVQSLKERADMGISLIVFPEGTFSYDPNHPLLQFHTGAFRIAIDTELPIVPVTIINTRSMLTKGKPPINPTSVQCYVSAPISTRGLTQDDAYDLKDQVYKIIEQQVIKYDDSFAHLR